MTHNPESDHVFTSAGHAWYHIRCWGDFAISGPDGQDVTPRARKARALLAWLALHPDRPVSRERLAGLLWGDRGEEQARASLRQTLYELRGFSQGPNPFLLNDRNAITLAGDRFSRDIDHPDQLQIEPGDQLFHDLDDIDDGFDEWLRFERTRQGERIQARVETETSRTSIRLLVPDFENRTGSPAMDPICRDLAADLRHILASFRELTVFGHSSSRRMHNGAGAGLPQATHIVEAELRTNADLAEVRLQVQDVKTGALIWVDHQHCTNGLRPNLRPSTAADVASALGIRGAPSMLAGSIDAAALDLYLEARRIAGPGESRVRCIAHYEAALHLAPDFAAAWAGLAQALAFGCRFDARTEPFEIMEARARSAALRALSLDPHAALAWAALGTLEPYAAYARREAQLDRAIAAAPHDVELLRQRGEAAHTVGRFQEASQFLLRAREIDSNNVLVVQNYAMILSETAPLADCVDFYVAARRLMPDFAWFFIADPWLIAANTGNWALVDRISAIAVAANLPELESVRWTVDALRNRSPDARERIVAAAERSLAKRNFVNMSTLVLAANIGLADHCFDWVERSDYAHLYRADGGVTDSKGHYQGVILGVCNRAMQADPRFVGLCAKIGLTRYWSETGRWPDCAAVLQARYGFIDKAKRNPGPEIASVSHF